MRPKVPGTSENHRPERYAPAQLRAYDRAGQGDVPDARGVVRRSGLCRIANVRRPRSPLLPEHANVRPVRAWAGMRLLQQGRRTRPEPEQRATPAVQPSIRLAVHRITRAAPGQTRKIQESLHFLRARADTARASPPPPRNTGQAPVAGGGGRIIHRKRGSLLTRADASPPPRSFAADNEAQRDAG
jgi:hypothetical protein